MQSVHITQNVTFINDVEKKHDNERVFFWIFVLITRDLSEFSANVYHTCFVRLYFVHVLLSFYLIQRCVISLANRINVFAINYRASLYASAERNQWRRAHRLTDDRLMLVFVCYYQMRHRCCFSSWSACHPSLVPHPCRHSCR